MVHIISPSPSFSHTQSAYKHKSATPTNLKKKQKKLKWIQNYGRLAAFAREHFSYLYEGLQPQKKAAVWWS